MPMPVPAPHPDEGSLGTIHGQLPNPPPTIEQQPVKKRARTDKGADDSDEERQEAMDMVDRANAGQPVLSGPAALGLEESDWEVNQGMTTGKTAHSGSGQLQASGQVVKSSPTSEVANL